MDMKKCSEKESLNNLNKKIIFIASNTNQVRMWTDISFQLRKLAPNILTEICSLNLYYGQVDLNQLVASNLEYFIFPRQYSNVVYWDCNPYEKILMYFEARSRATAFFKKFSPGLLVFGNDIGLLEQILLTEGNRRHIPTLLVQDGILREMDSLKSDLLRKIEFGFRNFFRYFPRTNYGLGGTTKIAVMGPYSRRLFEREGIHPDSIVETGHPRFDKLRKVRLELTDKERFDRKQSMGIKKDLPVICFITQPMIRYKYLDVQKWDQIVCDVIGSIKDLGSQCHFVIKLHPSESKDEFINRYYNEINESSLLLLHKEEISDILPLMDIVVVYNSTVSLEAIILDIPVIIYNPFDFKDDFHFAELGGAIITSSKADLKSAIFTARDFNTKSLSSPGRERTVKYHAGIVDGYARYRIAKLAQEMVTKAHDNGLRND